jgi:hypothetical protein
MKEMNDHIDKVSKDINDKQAKFIEKVKIVNLSPLDWKFNQR